jgi:glycosyltransferase involved in cell wall biosynthesis
MKSIKSLAFLCVERLLSRCTDKIICISEAEYMSALNHNIADSKKLDLILNGIDFSLIEKAEIKKRSELGIPEKAYVIGMIGRISPQKAPDVFLKAARLIMDEVPNAYFMIVGDGEERTQIELYAKEYNVNLYISGWTNAPYQYLKVFDMAMLLSRWEGFGLAIVEYMAARKNFVATRVDAIPTIVRDGVDGILVDVDSPIQAANAVIKLYKDDELANKMKESAWEYAHERYDIHRVAGQHIKLFEELLK